MNKTFCDKCNCEINIIEEFNKISYSTFNFNSTHKPLQQQSFDLCNKCKTLFLNFMKGEK